jgi:hypothetical protein
MSDQRPPDPVEAAIAAANGPKQVLMSQVNVPLLGRQDRPAVLAVPSDISDVELLALIGAVLQVGDQLRSQRPTSRLVSLDGGRIA